MNLGHLTVDQLQRQLLIKQNERARVEGEIDWLYADLERKRRENPQYWVHGEGSEVGVGPSFDNFYRRLDVLDQEIREIEEALRQGIERPVPGSSQESGSQSGPLSSLELPTRGEAPTTGRPKKAGTHPRPKRRRIAPDLTGLKLVLWVVGSLVGLGGSLWVLDQATFGSLAWWLALIIGFACVPGVLVVVYYGLILALVVLALWGIVALIQYFMKHPY